MAFDRDMFTDKLRRYCEQMQLADAVLSQRTGISSERLKALKEKQVDPTGDEVLILADVFMCDYRFFISNEKLAPFEQTESLFRKHGDKLSAEDRWAIQEFLFLCECEQFLQEELGIERKPFSFAKQGNYFKGHAEEAAQALRRHLNYQPHEQPMDVFRDFRTIGCHVFRRRLVQGNISGLCLRHPVAGPCLLINFNEDQYRQRFSAAHEAAHAILDDDQEFVVSFTRWDRNDLSEVRANTFASRYLMPLEFLQRIPDPSNWSEEKVVDWAGKLMVNIQPLLIALKNNGQITAEQEDRFSKCRLPKDTKHDPELSANLSPAGQTRKGEFIERGLSQHYAGLCFQAYEQGIVSSGRLAEMLLLTETELPEIASMYGRSMSHVS